MNNDKAVRTPTGGWMWESEKNKIDKFFEDRKRKMLMQIITPGGAEKFMERCKRNEDNLKWAWVFIGKTRKMVWVDNKTMKAYKADGYNKTNIEIKHFTFDRWCTSFDL